jgi:DNA-binding LacI/PurR family transcriptional regulator
MVNLKEIAIKANVSIATASLALNDSKLISKKTKEKIRKCAKKLNYYPNIYAKKLAKGKSYNICIMLNSKYFFKSPQIYYLRIIGGIIKESEDTEYTVSFYFYNEDTEIIGEKSNIKIVDGIIILDVIDKKTLNILNRDFNVPIVLIDNHKNFINMYGVDNDDFGGAYKATKYLIELGHKKIGYIGIPETHPLGRESWNGFKKAMDESDMKEVCYFKDCKFGIKSGRDAIKHLLANGSLPTAFCCVNDYIAIGAMEELKSKGYNIPDEVSFIGADDMELSSEIDPPLTTIRINMEELGRVGIRKLISIINNNYTGELKTIIDNELIDRGSCKSIA